MDGGPRVVRAHGGGGRGLGLGLAPRRTAGQRGLAGALLQLRDPLLFLVC